MFQSHGKRFYALRSSKHQRRRRPRVEQLEDRRLLATFTVQANLDVVDLDDGVTSLREAIAIANVSPGPDQIVFDFGHDGPATIRLTLGEILVTGALTITGDGPDLLTIDARNASRIFNFIVEEGDFTISGMTLRGGRALGSGGAVRSMTSGLLSIDHSVITGSYAQPTSEEGGVGGGVFAEGDVVLNYSTISDNLARQRGGGIHSLGRVTVHASTIAGNTGEKYGRGGIDARGLVTITGSTISGNSGGVVAGDGVRMSNSTVSGNSGVGVSGGGSVVIESSTITGNEVFGSGVSSEGALTIRNSIVAENLGFFEISSGTETFDIEYSLIGDNSYTGLAEAPLGMPDGKGNLIGGPIHGTIDPMLGPLQDNGGLTFTHALLPVSPAIDAGDPAAVAGQSDVPEFDQRGAARVAEGNGDGNARIDMGAYELSGAYQIDVPMTLVVDTLIDEWDGDFSAGNVSLREAIVLANFADGPNEIVFDHDRFDTAQTLNLSFGDLTITDTLAITGPGAELLVIDAAPRSRIFKFVAQEGDFAIAGMTLRGGRDAGGGAIRSQTSGVLSIDHSVISENRAERIQVVSGTLRTIKLEGGGVFARGPVRLNDSTIVGNSAQYGGGIYSTDRVTITGSTISGNTAVAEGGGVWAQVDLHVANSTVSGNDAIGVSRSDLPQQTGTGGGIWGGGSVTIKSSTIAGNSAEVAAGIHSNALLEVRNSIVAGNSGAGEIASVAEMYDVQFSLIGDNAGTNLVEAPVGMPDASGNLIGGPMHGAIGPLLGPLQDNGGPTLTHAPLPGSPVIDAGDPSAVAGQDELPEFDQRGAPYARVDVLGGQVIDLGAVEVFPLPSLPGDYNLDGIVNTIDYVFYRDRVGQSVMPYTSADGDGNGMIDPTDYRVWRDNYGNTSPPPGENAAVAGQRESPLSRAIAKLLPIRRTGESLGRQDTTVESDAVFTEIGWRGERALEFGQRVR